MRAVLGIDPGQDGGWAVLSGEEAYGEPLPLVGREIDPVTFRSRVMEYCNLQGYRIGLAMIEDVGVFGQEAPKAMFNFGYNVGVVTGICLGEGWPFDRVKPKVWKKAVIPHVRGLPRKGQKDGACAWVARRYPDVELRPGRKRVPHDGVAEAVCIAVFGIGCLT